MNTSDQAPDDKARRRRRIVNIVFAVIWSIGLLLSLPLLLTAPFMFDSPGSLESGPTRLLFLSTFAYPLTALISLIGSHLAYKRHRYGLNRLLNLLPLLGIALFAMAMLYFQRVCHGLFSCGH